MNKEKEILENLRKLISQKRNEYIEVMQQHENTSPYYHYCKGKKDMLEDILGFIANQF